MKKSGTSNAVVWKKYSAQFNEQGLEHADWDDRFSIADAVIYKTKVDNGHLQPLDDSLNRCIKMPCADIQIKQ